MREELCEDCRLPPPDSGSFSIVDQNHKGETVMVNSIWPYMNYY